MINLISCRLWGKTIFTHPKKFLRWATLRVDPTQYPSQRHELIKSRILYKVPKIKIFPNTRTETVEFILQVAGEGKLLNLNKITITLAPTSLTNVSPEILAQAAVKLKGLEFQSMPSSVQIQAILTRIATTQNSNLQQFLCSQMADMLVMNPAILSQALVKLKTLGYNGFLIKLSAGQGLALFSQVRDSPHLRLSELRLYWDVSTVPPQLFSNALSRLETVKFCSTSRVTPSQLDFLMMMISHPNQFRESKLKHLAFYDINLTTISPPKIVEAFKKLEKVEIFAGRMTVNQITEILLMLRGNQQKKLKNIRIFNPILNGSVSPTIHQDTNLHSSVNISITL